VTVEDSQFLQILMDSIPDHIYLKDRASRFTRVNRALARFYGCASPEEVVGKWDGDFYPPELAAQFRADEAHLFETGEPIVGKRERCSVAPDSTCWFSTTKVPVRDAAGTIIGLVGISREITAVKAAEEELHLGHNRLADLVRRRTAEREAADLRLQQSEERFRQLAENIREIFWLSEPNSRRMLYVSPAFEQLWGVARAVLSTNPGAWMEAIHPDDRPLVTQTLDQQMRGLATDVEFRLVQPDGGLRWIRNRGFPVRDSAGEVYRVAGVAEDVTARVQAEAALRAARDYLDKIINSIPDPIFVKDRQHRLILVNDAECALTGHPREEVLGRTDYEFFPKAQVDVFWEKDEAVFETGQENVNEEEITDASGRLRTIVTKKTLYTDPDGNKFIVGIVRDITERKRAREAARRHREELAHAGRVSTIGEMASGLAHELAQPLSAILYFARGAATQLEHGRWGVAQAEAALRKVAAQAERAGEFIHRLKAFVRKGQARRVLSDLNDIVRDVLEFLRTELRDERIVVRLELGEDLPKISADPIQIEQVIVNLVRNGIEALAPMPPGERTLSIRTAAGPDRTVCLNVRDSGNGLTPEAAEHLFETFYTTKPNGTGLGLPISRTLIEELHGGRLWVAPHPAGGVEAGFSLPAVKGSADADG
jgi:PAS domain S-box-containing protein